MPELPEVETVRRYLQRTVGSRIAGVQVRRDNLRYPLDRPAIEALVGARICAVRRRAKYLLIDVDGPGVQRTMLLHLGMSGRLFLDTEPAPPFEPHEHLRWQLAMQSDEFAGPADPADTADTAIIQSLRFVDPRRFGSLDVAETAEISGHKLLHKLGPEPLGPHFTAAYLHARSRGRKVATKQLVMNGHIVVGVGNIYASEALWRAAISPHKSAGKLSKPSCARLVAAIVAVLTEAVAMGGTTLRDFVGGDSAPGYFQQRLDVYGRGGEACNRCADSQIRSAVMGGRMTYWCPRCQR